MLKGKTGKLELRTEVCMVVGYPKGTRGGLFYSPSNEKVWVSTNATFLKDDYLTNFKPRSKFVLGELRSDHIIKSPSTTDERQSQETTIPIQNILVPRLSGNDVETLSNVKKWLAEQFQLKYLGKTSYILGIQIIRDRKNKLLALSQASYIDNVVARFSMQDSKKGLLPTVHGPEYIYIYIYINFRHCYQRSII